MAAKKSSKPIGKVKKAVKKSGPSIGLFFDVGPATGRAANILEQNIKINHPDAAVSSIGILSDTSLESVNMVSFDLYVDLSDRCYGLILAKKNNKPAIALLCPESQHIGYKQAKLTFQTHVTFEENVLYHIGRFITGELQKEFVK